MLRRICLLLVLLTAMSRAHELAGLWTLQSVTQGQQKLQDPRWTCFLDFNASGHFTLTSQTVQEKWTTGGGATPIQRDVRIEGTYKTHGLDLTFFPEAPLSGEPLEFARVNFGKPDAHGNYHCRFSHQGGLQISSTQRTLNFARHEKRE